jgi:uncharacterized protein (DUF2384 family)
MSNYETILDRAEEVFGNKDRAEDWMVKVSDSLGTTPSKKCVTQEGMDKVLLHLIKIEQFHYYYG